MTTIRHSKEEKYMVEELKPMLENISGKKLDELCDDECLFSRKYAMNARDIVYFLVEIEERYGCLLYTSPSPRDYAASRMPSSA